MEEAISEEPLPPHTGRSEWGQPLERQVTAGVILLDGWFSKSTVRAMVGLLQGDLTKDCQTLWGYGLYLCLIAPSI